MRVRALIVVVAAACGGSNECDLDEVGTICTIAGTGTSELDAPDGPGTETALAQPIDLAMSPDGELWIIDFNNFLIRALVADGSLHTVAGNGMIGDSPPPDIERVPALEAAFNHPASLTFHDGYAYIAAWFNSRVKRIRLSDMTLENVAGRGKRTLYDGDGGPASEAALDCPSAVTFDPSGALTIMDQENQVIRQVDATGTIRTIAGRCIANGTECAAGQEPTACPGSQRVTCGPPSDCSFPCAPGFGGDGGPALAARMAQPFGAQIYPAVGMVYDATGNLYFADADNHRIRRIDTAGIITTVAGTGVAGSAGELGAAVDAQLNRPGDLAIGDDGTIYFSDTENSCIRSIDPAGTLRRVAGICREHRDGPDFSGDGAPALDARLNRPFGIALVGDVLYIADTFNNRVRAMRVR